MSLAARLDAQLEGRPVNAVPHTVVRVDGLVLCEWSVQVIFASLKEHDSMTYWILFKVVAIQQARSCNPKVVETDVVADTYSTTFSRCTGLAHTAVSQVRSTVELTSSKGPVSF